MAGPALLTQTATPPPVTDTIITTDAAEADIPAVDPALPLDRAVAIPPHPMMTGKERDRAAESVIRSRRTRKRSELRF